MKIGSPEHKKFQEENGKRLVENLEKTVKNGPPENGGLFDQMRFNFAKNLLTSIKNTKVK